MSLLLGIEGYKPIFINTNEGCLTNEFSAVQRLGRLKWRTQNTYVNFNSLLVIDKSDWSFYQVKKHFSKRQEYIVFVFAYKASL